MSGFSLSWLRRRAPFARAARDAALARRQAEAAAGTLSLRVGHRDVPGLPGEG